MKFNAKKLLVAALAVALVSAVSVAGTLALRAAGEGQADQPLVQITGTPLTGSIVPGTSQPYDGQVLLRPGDAGYVFLEVTDKVDKLVTYTLDEAWTPLNEAGYEGVYYRQVEARTAEQTFPILADGTQISYSAALKNEDMLDENDNLKQDLALTFKAYAVLDPNFNLDQAKLMVPKEVSTGVEFSQAVTGGRSVRLTQDIQLPWSFTITEPVVIDLNNKTISNHPDKPYAIVVKNAEVKIRNGTICSGYAEVIQSDGTKIPRAGMALRLQSGADVTVDNCTLKVTGEFKNNVRYESYAVYVEAPAADETAPKLVMNNCTIDTTDTRDKKPTATNNDPGSGGYAAFIMGGNVTMKDCDVTGWVCIYGGDVTLDGGNYATRRRVEQRGVMKDKPQTANDVARRATSTNPITWGDCITIMDGGQFDLKSVTIQNIAFDNTLVVRNDGGYDEDRYPVYEMGAYVIKYVDVNPSDDNATLTIQNNTYTREISKIVNPLPAMFIDKDGNDLEDAPANPLT